MTTNPKVALESVSRSVLVLGLGLVLVLGLGLVLVLVLGLGLVLPGRWLRLVGLRQRGIVLALALVLGKC